ncbi:hypothetical protein AB0H42_24195 [Nocardia sp. NPDC050799]|uniref:hypothetical protein n=1 Tax=Nocardia sp. NPDC050799 TaxID=3154842 RepID=UPI003407E3A9
MTASNAVDITELGVIGTTKFSLASTNRPWELDIDTIAVSVGAGVGSLGSALREAYPDAAWSSIRYELIDACRPRLFALLSTRPEQALLVNPRESGGDEGALSDDILRLGRPRSHPDRGRRRHEDSRPATVHGRDPEPARDGDRGGGGRRRSGSASDPPEQR